MSFAINPSLNSDNPCILEQRVNSSAVRTGDGLVGSWFTESVVDKSMTWEYTGSPATYQNVAGDYEFTSQLNLVKPDGTVITSAAETQVVKVIFCELSPPGSIVDVRPMAHNAG